MQVMPKFRWGPTSKSRDFVVAGRVKSGSVNKIHSKPCTQGVPLTMLFIHVLGAGLSKDEPVHLTSDRENGTETLIGPVFMLCQNFSMVVFFRNWLILK